MLCSTAKIEIRVSQIYSLGYDQVKRRGRLNEVFRCPMIGSQVEVGSARLLNGHCLSHAMGKKGGGVEYLSGDQLESKMKFLSSDEIASQLLFMSRISTERYSIKFRTSDLLLDGLATSFLGVHLSSTLRRHSSRCHLRLCTHGLNSASQLSILKLL